MAFPASSVCVSVCVCVWGGGGFHEPTLDLQLDWSLRVGTLIFSSYVGLVSSSTVYPPKILGITRKYLKFLQPQKISLFCTFTLRKDTEIHEKTRKTSPILL